MKYLNPLFERIFCFPFVGHFKINAIFIKRSDIHRFKHLFY